ncbi:MAG: GMC family oxidoreductase [Anaerolineae bacterium]|nr:GMC family oxidoreductase [Anaerolineae bacterium]
MIIDANTIQPDSTFEADVCIVGSGPAGLTLAREFANQPLDVIVLESGGFMSNRALKKLNEGTTDGDPYPNPRWGRQRQFGGTPHRWGIHINNSVGNGARYAPLDAIDFEKRDYVPYSGWPITREEMDPYYERAQEHCGIGPYAYDTKSWEKPGFEPLDFGTGRLVSSMFQFGSKDVWTKHHDDVTQKANNVRVITNASAVEIETDDGGENVTGVRALNHAQQTVRVRATYVILAVGCIESARLLLLSRAKHRDGIGNQHDVVGRYFMDHPQSYLNIMTPTNRKIFNQAKLYDLRPNGDYGIMGKLTFSEDTLRKEQLMNGCYVLFPRRDHFMSEAFQSFFTMLLTVIHAQRPTQIGFHAKQMLKGWHHLAQIGLWQVQGKAPYPYLARGGWSDIPDPSSLFSVFEVFSLLEQAPDPTNRVTLIDDVDPNGTQKVNVHWKFTEMDRDTVARSRKLFEGELQAANMGSMVWHPDPYTSASSVHPIGTTRMGTDPQTSVTDGNCMVRGVNNLYIASSGVFATSGYANPTLTVVALACRIADRVKASLKRVPEVKPVASDPVAAK